MTALNGDGIKKLRLIPAFSEYAHSEILSDRNFWEREAQFGVGIMRAVAIAVVEIGSDQK